MLLRIAVAFITVAACGGQQGPLVRVDGSSTVYPITEAVAEELGKTGSPLKVTVGVSGTGGGFKKFCAGETDISNASRPIKAAETEACAKAGVAWIELPIAYDGIAIVVNPKNTWATDITVAELKRLWQPEAQKQVTRWSQIREGWPDKEIHLFGPGTDSGTFDYFTEAIVGKEDASRGDYTASEDDNMLVQGIAGDELALGYFGFAYWVENKERVKIVPVDDQKPESGAGAIAPSLASIADGSYQPLSRPLFIYVSKKAIERPEVQAFTSYYLEQAGKLVAEVGFVPLPGQAYPLAKRRLDARTTGSLFAKGSQIGVSIEDLLAREAL